MSLNVYKQFYERHLPHIHPPDATFFITFRLAGSIPKAIIREYTKQKLVCEKLRDSVDTDWGCRMAQINQSSERSRAGFIS